MKKQLLLLAALSLSFIGAYAQGTWIPQATGFPNTSTGVFNVSVCDSSTVWISSYDGSGGGADYRDFSMTIDGGATWIPGVIPAPTTHAWSQIFGLDATTAWAVMYNAVAGSGGGIWKTTDGGATWNQQGAGTIFNASSFPNLVHFWDANEGFAMGDPNPTGFEIYTTVDGGTTWVPVPAVNIPAPLAGEYGIVNHYEVLGNTVWFDTNKGRVYKSTDKGLTWTVSSTGLVVPANGAIDIVFYDANNGFARLYNGTTGVNTVKRTVDGGATWTAGTATGNMFGSDLSYVPGTTSRIVSTGAATGFIGSSYSDDGGLTWIDIELTAQRTALGVFNANIMWAGGFTTSPISDGIYKYTILASVACGDPSIASGVASAPDSTICFGDTLFVTTAGAVSPSVGTTFGWAMIVSSGDISFNNDPLNQPGILGGTGVVYPASANQPTTLVNDGVTFPAGVYYFTPVVFGNAFGTGNISGLTLDPACTYTGQSVMVTLYSPGDPACNTAVACGDPTISSGVTSAIDSTICFGDDLLLTTLGAVTPNTGTTFGWSMLVSSGDISFNTDPLGQPGIVAGTGTVFPIPSPLNTTLTNDGSLLPAGVYYFTPLVYGNATGTGNVTTLTLDPACTYTGQSVMITLYAAGDPLCNVGLNELNASVLSMNAYQVNENEVSLNLLSAKQTKVEVNVFDLAGRLVLNESLSLSQGANSHMMDISNLGAGTYVIRVSDNNNVVTGKMVRY